MAEDNNDEFIPFGADWKKEMMKHEKEYLIELLKSAYQDRLKLKEELLAYKLADKKILA